MAYFEIKSCMIILNFTIKKENIYLYFQQKEEVDNEKDNYFITGNIHVLRVQQQHKQQPGQHGS